MFGDFPHDGKLSPLWFRIIKRGLPLPIDPRFGEFHHFAVGEGQNQYFTYICQKKAQNGQRLLITRGVDLLADTPEGACLLDAMIDYALSDAFVAERQSFFNCHGVVPLTKQAIVSLCPSRLMAPRRCFSASRCRFRPTLRVGNV